MRFLSGKAKVKRQKAKVKTKQYRAPEQFLYLKTFTYLLICFYFQQLFSDKSFPIV